MTALPERHVSLSDEWLRRDSACIAPVLDRRTDIVVVRGEGSWLVDADGRSYLDLTSGIAVTNLGHCHPAVVDAVQRQAQELVHTSVVAHHPRGIELAERLRGLTPFIDDPLVFFCNSGAEAVDGAIKLARRTTGRSGVIAFRGGFHGRTMGATSITTAKEKYRAGYEPLLEGVAFAPYGADLAVLDELLAQVAPTTGAMIVEPALGEGGYVIPPREWLAGLRDRCDRLGMLLVFDEVQTGVGRTGSFWGAEAFGVVPDVLLFAKGIANGLPLGGIIAPRSVMERWPTGTHGSTFGGNPGSCAAALATIDVIEREDVLARVRSLGARVLKELRGVAPLSLVRDVRGMGLMIGVEFADEATCGVVRRACLDDGVILIDCGPDSNVLRLMPSLVISDKEIGFGLEVLSRAMRRLAR